jgi:hypothetical protein
MFLLAHLAAAYLAARVWNLVAPRRQVSTLLAMFGGVLPDLIDKPLALLPGWDAGRSVAHTVLFTLALFALTRLHRGFLPIAFGAATHILLDDPSTYLATFAWPFLGPTFTPDDDLSLEALHRHITKPRTGMAEIAGGVLLLSLAADHVRTILKRRRGRTDAAPQLGRVRAVARSEPIAPNAVEMD